MPASAPFVPDAIAAKLAAIGGRLRAHRKALGVSATTAAEAAGMSRMTLHRIERGEPSVTMGAYISAAGAIGLDLDLVGAGPTRALPKSISLAQYPQLRRIAWQLGPTAAVSPKEALSLYERNWRHVDMHALSEQERELIRLLGGAKLLV